MFGINSLFIIEQALIIMALLYIFARLEADFEFSTVLLVSCGIVAGNCIMGLMMYEQFGVFVIIPIFFFTCWLLVKFCWVSWPKGLLITTLYFILFAAVEIGKGYYQTGRLIWEMPIATKSDSAQGEYEKKMKEGLEAVKALNEGTARMVAAAHDGVGTSAPPATAAAAGTNAAAAAATAPVETAVPAVAPAPAPPPPVVPSNEDWTGARAKLRIRGWVNGSNGSRAAMVNEQIVEVGGTASIDHNGLRYRWRLVELRGYQPTWEQLTTEPGR